MSEMKGFFAMFEESNEEEATVDLRECKNEGKGYKTLIPDEVFEKCKDLMKAHEDLRETLGKYIPDIQMKALKIPSEDTYYAMAEYIMFNDIMKEAWDKITDLVAIHEYASKEEMDDECKKQGISLRELVMTRIMSDMMDFMTK